MSRTLFNNCTDMQEPEWGLYDAFEINCCASDPESECVGTCSLHKAEMFTVYGHYWGGGCEAITDTTTRKLAHAIARRFCELSGIDPSNIRDFCRER